MTFQSLVRGACAVLASLVLASCGGGGAKTNPNQGGDLSIQPATGTFYAGVVSRLTLSGGRTPYSLTSSEPTVLDVPAITSSHFLDVVPNNPGTIDQGLPADALPIRTIVITLRDSQGLEQQAKIAVAHNFLTGYSIVFTPSTCPTGANACAGGETVVMWDTVTNGVRIGDRPFIVSMVAGPCLFENPPVAGAPGTGNLTTSISTASDHEGKVTVVMYCPANVSPQVGLLRLIDAGSGASTTAAFTVTASAASQGLTAIPASFTFTGPDSATCGSGTADFFVFGGQPPFQAVSSDSSITVTPVDVTHNPAHFQVTAGSASKCVDATVIVTDATGGRTTVEVKTAAGSAPPATQPTPLVLTPSSISLTCGQSTSVLVTGGTGGGSVSFASSDSNLTVTGGSGTLTVKRNGALPVLPGGNHTSTINVTDGTSITTLSVDNPVNCS